ncbi:hypothetical protein EDD18DRAFT_1100631 [Armillaria luteobubalina]|uniref:Uncharacterized protein n=1 Tax=Armillaria luteobubalina TaxID=153913 RepID=A0AA39QGT6_9AGAR|nr:hypothetical protein EDD18DRAFT_1100631 [Armillaria luteobubalina]
MLPECSQDFLEAKWVQCNISFKRVPGWNKFELCDRTWVRISSTGICTLLLLKSIEGYCTGQLTNIADRPKDIAREMGKERMDLHEPASCAVPDYRVKEKMHSLLCVWHPDWDGAIAYIEWEGGASGQAWLNNKRDSKFALQGMCWEKSFIPLSIWQAGDTMTNAVEMSHIDIYREGGISRTCHYDKMRLHIHRVTQKVGVKASYRPTTVVVSVARKYKCTVIHCMRKFNSMDKSIGDQNEWLRKSWEWYQSALHRLSVKPTDLNTIESAEKHKKAYEKHKQKSLDMRQRLCGQSSGQVRIVILE